MADDPAARTALSSSAWVAGSTALLVVYVAIQSSIDLDPASLWLDDAWVVALSNAPAYGMALVQPASAPPLFMALVGLAVDLAPDLECGAQFWPYLFGLIAVALTALLAYRITESALCAVVAAAILATDSSFLVYIARVKPFTGDILVVLLQGLCFHQLTHTYTRRRLWIYCAVAATGFALSSLSILVAAAGSAVAWVTLWHKGVRDRQLGLAGLVLVVAAGYFALRIASQPSAELLLDYWQAATLSTEDSASFVAGLYRVGSTWAHRLAHAGPYASAAVAGHAAFPFALAMVGCAWLWREGRRVHLFVGAGVVIVCAAASAAGRLPLGTNRVGLFLLPFAAIVLSSAFGFLADLPIRARRVAVALVVVLAALVLPAKRAPHYPREISAPLVEQVASSLTAGDGFWINHPTSYATAIYGPWPYGFVHDPNYPIPRPQLDDPGFAVLEVLPGEARTARVAALPSNPPTAYVLMCHAQPGLLASVEGLLASAGYRTPHITQNTPGCLLRAYRRKAASSGRGG
ncbi:MAG: hypothetical protein GY733_21140 [bacterium]|nr:hypothetical protein [bacterium]